MDCLNPLTVYYCGQCIAKDGVRSPRLVFSFDDAVNYWLGILPEPSYLIAAKFAQDNSHSLTCGKCAACQIRKRKDMTTRISHETRMHDECCFITLTYNDDNLPCVDFPPVATLVPADVQKFIKRLRRHLEYVPKKKALAEKRDHVKGKIRYFCVGEYGTKTKRPHYHLIIFGWKPSDQEVWKLQKGYTINRSAQIEKLWTKGFSTVCDVNGGVAAYCARYVTKKFARLEDADIDDQFRFPEFILQSTRGGGIGSKWLDRYYENLEHGYVNVEGSNGTIYKASIPKYYYDRIRKTHLPFWIKLRDQRIDFIKKRKDIGDEVLDSDRVFRKVACEFDRYHKETERETI